MALNDMGASTSGTLTNETLSIGRTVHVTKDFPSLGSLQIFSLENSSIHIQIISQLPLMET